MGKNTKRMNEVLDLLKTLIEKTEEIDDEEEELSKSTISMKKGEAGDLFSKIKEVIKNDLGQELKSVLMIGEFEEEGKCVNIKVGRGEDLVNVLASALYKDHGLLSIVLAAVELMKTVKDDE